MLKHPGEGRLAEQKYAHSSDPQHQILVTVKEHILPINNMHIQVMLF